MPRRRSRSFSRSRMQKGRQGLWVRQPSFSWTVRSAGLGVASDLVITPNDWEREFQVGTQPKRGAGGPVLQRMFVKIGINFVYTQATDGTLIVPGVETLIWTQDAAFSTQVTSNTSFDDTLLDNRVLHYGLIGTKSQDVVAGTEVTVNWMTDIEVKAKARLSQVSVGVAFRTNFDTASTGAVDFSSLGIVSSYLTTP